VKRNPSNKTPLELSRIFYRDILDTDDLPRSLFDASISIQAIIHLPHMAGEDIGTELEGMLDDGDLDELLFPGKGREIKEATDLVHIQGFIVKAHAQKWDFKDTKFGKDGVMDSCHNDFGSYIVLGFGKDLDAAYKAMIEKVVTLQAKQIEKGLKEVAK
jgi:hypothetical protein